MRKIVSTYETIYNRLKPVLAALADSEDGYAKLESAGFMDLHIDMLKDETGEVKSEPFSLTADDPERE